MPRSKRNRVFNVTKVDKKDKAQKAELISAVRQHAEEYQYVWVFDVEHMRNKLLQEVRGAWHGSRIFMGKNGVIKKAMGITVEDECRLGISKVANLISGTVGILFTNEEPQVVIDWVDSFRKADFCRSGNIVDETFAIPAGPISLGPEEGVAPHSLEPQFRKLGLHTTLERGVPTLNNPHTVCTKGDTLNANQVQLLKLFMKPLATFQIVLLLGVNMADGSVVGGTKAEEL